jgi:hypothetical protein
MPYIQTICPPINDSADELRKWVEEEFRRVALANAESDVIINALKPFVTAGAYSEAVWTPVLSSIGGGTPPTFTTKPLTGYYVRLGKLVIFSAYGSNTAGGVAGSGTNQLQLTLPLPAYAGINPIRVHLGVAQNSGVENLLEGQVVDSATQISLYQMTGISQMGPLTCASLNNVARSLEILGTYRVA